MVCTLPAVFLFSRSSHGLQKCSSSVLMRSLWLLMVSRAFSLVLNCFLMAFLWFGMIPRRFSVASSLELDDPPRGFLWLSDDLPEPNGEPSTNHRKALEDLQSAAFMKSEGLHSQSVSSMRPTPGGQNNYFQFCFASPTNTINIPLCSCSKKTYCRFHRAIPNGPHNPPLCRTILRSPWHPPW